jgi:hypothetical protein
MWGTMLIHCNITIMSLWCTFRHIVVYNYLEWWIKKILWCQLLPKTLSWGEIQFFPTLLQLITWKNIKKNTNGMLFWINKLSTFNQLLEQTFVVIKCNQNLVLII